MLWFFVTIESNGNRWDVMVRARNEKSATYAAIDSVGLWTPEYTVTRRASLKQALFWESLGYTLVYD